MRRMTAYPPKSQAQQQPAILSPIAAYDAFAPYYSSYSERRRRYLRKVEEIVISNIRGARSLLDVGAGDGSRAFRIATAAGIGRLALLEPSAEMRARCVPACECWPCGPLEVPDECPPFDAILCLWNVLGHIRGTERRILVLAKLKKLLAAEGAMFLDVTHRYNAASYGWGKTFLRAAGDCFIRSDARRDIIVSWRAGDQVIRTHGHAFTHAEMKRLFGFAGLKIQQRWAIHYESGRERRLPLFGNLLYKVTSG